MIGGEEQWVGQVDRFVRLEFVGEGGGEAVRPLRVALVDFFEYCAPMCDKDWGVVHKVVLGADGLPSVNDHSFLVQICRIRGKLIYADGVARVSACTLASVCATLRPTTICQGCCEVVCCCCCCPVAVVVLCVEPEAAALRRCVATHPLPCVACCPPQCFASAV